MVQGAARLAGFGERAKAFARSNRPPGPGSCWVGAAMDWLRAEEGALAVGVPDGFAPVAPILLGYPTAAPVPRHNGRPEIVWS